MSGVASALLPYTHALTFRNRTDSCKAEGGLYAL